MKSYRILLIFIFITSFYIVKATDYTWTGSGTDDNFTNPDNWDVGASPTSMDNIFFNIGGDITVDIGFVSGFNNLTISNNSIVTFISTGSGVFLNCNIITIDTNSEFKILGSDDIQITINSAEIYGSVFLDEAEHKILPSSSSTIINFYDGSSFTAGQNLIGSPFGDTGVDNVNFFDNTYYYHFGGNSPFGTSAGSSVTKFYAESNYYILNDGSTVMFSNKTYGNIYIGQTSGTYMNVNVVNTGTGSEFFSFNTITTENGALLFSGSNADKLQITGGIEATSGNVELKAGTFSFSGDCFIASDISTPHDIKFTSYETSSFTIIDNNSSLTLESKFTIESDVDIFIDGIVDFKTNQILWLGSTSNLQFTNTAQLITANSGGINGSFYGGIGYLLGTETTVEYNSSIEFQNIGLPDGFTVGKLIVNNPQNVKMQYDLIIDSLFLDQGNLQIESNSLIIQKNIDYNGGHLFGGSTSNLSFVNDVADVLLDQDLTLNSLTIDGINTAVELDGGLETGLNYLNIDNGSINLNNNSLRVNNEVNLNGGQLDIFGGTLKIGGTITIATAAMLIGGPSSNLEFLSTAENAVLTINELSDLLIQTSNEITLGDNLTIQNFLGIENGILSISNYELVLNGDYQTGGYLKGDINSNLIIEGVAQDLDITFFINSEFNSLQIDRPNSTITITNPITIFNNLELTNGKIRTVSELTIDNYCSLNYNNNSYIEIGGVGSVTKYIYDSDNFEFPIGTENGFAPVTISPNSSENFTVSVNEGVFENGYDGSTFTDDRIINLTWNISSPSSNYNIKLNWFDEVIGANFEQSNSYVSFFNTSTNLWEQITLATTNDVTNEIKVDNISQTGVFYVSSIYNMSPIIENQTFEILEHSTIGTIVGQIEATDPDFNNFSFSAQDINTNLDAFNFDRNGQITVKNSDIMEFSNQAIYRYLVTVCDDGQPNECSEAEITIEVTEFNIVDFYITNFISPNGDGINDTWIINGPNDAIYMAEIYDKKGNLVYKTDNYQNDWAGTNYGTPLPPGVYYYHVTALMPDVQPNYKGTITIVK